ncbi:MAG: bifunctional DNA-formamidopyrimidine glycosylase/DNA-(apurinic or apyrimidinic site) lyase [Candidatus Melainabacteria bacterium]|nr:bifunctional DNA-formamidopyrimidine glycosylase/DNA-(apurinic or apyrimidinic site) lyase [Candidatus Melainabacteria bacterium]
MPELPEVETVVRGIAPLIEGLAIAKAQVLNSKLRIEIPQDFARAVKGKTITKVKRKAKYILIDLDSGFTIVIHLGMSGRLRVYPDPDEYSKAKHDHLIIELRDKSILVFNDTRKFGLVTLLREEQFSEFKFFRKLGLEPLSKEFNSVELFRLVKNRNKSIKSVIMDSSIVVGVGNIYASESLFSAGIHPERIASSLTKKEATDLYKAIVNTLERAIEAGGSTLKDYAKPNGEAGYFQHQFLVYDRLDMPCSKCSRPIHQIRQNGRSTYFCGKCQH